MTIQRATPYLMLGGRASQAISFYEKALGAKVEARQTFGDVDRSCPEARRDFIMHAELRFGEAVLMLSDGPEAAPQTDSAAVSIALLLNDRQEAQHVFTALAEGGRTVQPLIDAPWGALFGVVQDRFGFSWMFNAQ